MNTTHQKSPAKKEESSILQMLPGFLPFWPLFVFFLVISMAWAFLYLRYTVPMYEASAKIIINDEKKGNDDSKFVESLDQINSKKIIENEIEVLQSAKLMADVVRKLNLYAPIYEQGKVNIISAYLSSPVTIEAYSVDSIQAAEKIQLKYNSAKKTVQLNNAYEGTINEWLNTPFGKLRFLENKKYRPSKNQKPFFFSLVPLRKMAGYLTSPLKVSATSKLSSTIELTYRDEIPERAEDILNALVVSYGDEALKEKNNLARNTLAFITERLRVVKNDLDSIERTMQQYKTGRGAVDISRQGQIYLENMSTNDKRLTDLNMQISTLGQLEKYATSSGNSAVLPSTLGINDATLTQQVNNLNSLQSQYDKLKTSVGENNPVLLSLAEQINKIKPTIVNNIQSQRQSLEQNKSSIYAAGGKYSSLLSSIPQTEKQLIEISRDQNIKNGIYSFLLQKREESELSLASTLSDSKVVSFALASGAPVSPKKMFTYIMALLAGLGLPILIIRVKEALSPKILFRKEIENLTQIPVIAEISFCKAKGPFLVSKGERSIYAEEFRKLRVSLLAVGIDEYHKKILVTSSIPGEGKSFVSANLATSISLTGKRVVLVDADLHNPGLGRYLGFQDKAGIIEYLTGDKESSQIISSVEGNENLFYIPSGKLKSDASELLQNGRIHQLIAELDAAFDVVIIDTAPIVLITDAYLLSALCDATLYIVRHKFTPKSIIKRIDHQTLINPINNPAIIFNGLKKRGFSKTNNGYGYNNYLYGYGKNVKL